nr:hypothetical protein Iba_chr10cCG13590 [Ipomoea batatas]
MYEIGLSCRKRHRFESHPPGITPPQSKYEKRFSGILRVLMFSSSALTDRMFLSGPSIVTTWKMFSILKANICGIAQWRALIMALLMQCMELGGEFLRGLHVASTPTVIALNRPDKNDSSDSEKLITVHSLILFATKNILATSQVGESSPTRSSGKYTVCIVAGFLIRSRPVGSSRCSCSNSNPFCISIQQNSEQN